MELLNISKASFAIKEGLSCHIENLVVNTDSLWVLVGANASGKSSVAKAIAGAIECTNGQCVKDRSCKCALVSFERQSELFEDDFKYRNSDTNSDEELNGIRVSDYLSGCNKEYVTKAMELLHIDYLYDRPVRVLSGGEGRKIMIVKAICSDNNLIVLDTPFDALDTESRCRLIEIIEYIHQNTACAIVLIVNRKEEIPQSASNFGLISALSLKKTGDRKLLDDSDFASFLNIVSLPQITIPKAPFKFIQKDVAGDNLVTMHKVNITYDRVIFKDFDFTLNKGDHYQISGPNGCGKSTLISLITGDNPLVYVNDITVFGYKRGQGESIWDIKKYYGLVSGALHLDYRVSSPVINVILSGFYDSIGLYTKASDDEIKCARAWLEIAGLSHLQRRSFKELSFGQQRLVLIIRALIKIPPLLILDEPLQGLDTYGRELVKEFISVIIENSKTTVIFVSHHTEDTPRGIKYNLRFVPCDGDYTIENDRI